MLMTDVLSYKTRICANFQQTGTCRYSTRCTFAHGEDDMRSTEQNVKDELFTEQALRSFQANQRRSARQQQGEPRKDPSPTTVNFKQQQQQPVESQSEPPPLVTFPVYQFQNDQQPAWDSGESSMSLSRSMQSTLAGSTHSQLQGPPMLFSQHDRPDPLASSFVPIKQATFNLNAGNPLSPPPAGNCVAPSSLMPFQVLNQPGAAQPMVFCFSQPMPVSGPISQPLQYQQHQPQQQQQQHPVFLQGYSGGPFPMQQQQQPVYLVPCQPNGPMQTPQSSGNFVYCFPQC